MVLYSIGRALGHGPMISATITSITGTGAITTGLTTIDAAVTDANKAGVTGTPWAVSCIIGIAAGTVTVDVGDYTTAPAVPLAVAPYDIHCIATGRTTV